MNLCLVCRDVGASHGGMVRTICDLGQALAQEGNSVHLVTDGPGPGPPEVTTIRAPAALARALGEPEPESAAHNLIHAASVYREVRRIHEQEQRVDAVIAPLWRSEGALCILDHRFPTIVSCMTSLRTLTEIDPAYHSIADIDERLSLERQSLRRSRYLHGLTSAVLEKTVGDYALLPGASAVIGRGLRDRYEGGVREEVSGAPVRVLFVGRLERRKGVDVLLAAASELLASGAVVTFTLVGADHDPSLRASLEHQASEQHHRESVRFAGVVDDRELNRLYAEADIVCCPSRYESHGVVLIEAMMFGKAIVTCDAGGITEVVEPGRDALLCPPGSPAALAETLRALLDDPQLRSRLGGEARKSFGRRFEARSVARRMGSFIEAVSAEHRAQRTVATDTRTNLEGLLIDALHTPAASARAFASELLARPAFASPRPLPGWPSRQVA